MSASQAPQDDSASLAASNTAASSNVANDQEKDDEDQVVWFREEERWELTWPIWHMLPHQERKALASKYGYQTIGEFEEFMTLQRAVGETTTNTAMLAHQQPFANNLLYAADTAQSENDVTQVGAKNKSSDEEDEQNDSEQGDTVLVDDLLSDAGSEELEQEELLKRAGTILMLPEELIHKLLQWLPIDIYATLALVSPHWKYLTRTESVYRRLCERCYLIQSKRKTLNVSRFGNSYRTMLENRPRVRAGGGLYVMKYASVKKIQRDMWTEIPVGAILETVYYRYIYFQENGKCVYALTNDPPHEMIRRFWKMMATKQPDKAAVWGCYQVAKNTITVVAEQAWQVVRLEMSILPHCSIYGKYGTLSFDRHTSSADGTFDHCGKGVVEYKVPNEVFRFVKDRRL